MNDTPESNLPPPPQPPAPAPRSPLPASTILGDFVGSALDRVAAFLGVAFVERSLAFARDVGQYAILAGVGLTLIYAIFAAIKFNSFALFMTGIGLIAAIAVAQFAAKRFLAAAVRIIDTTPSRIASPAFLECAGLLMLLAALGTFLGGVVASIRAETVLPLLPALLFAASLTYGGAIALHPKIVNVEPADSTAGEEAIGLLAFFAKTGLRLVPLYFLLLAIGGDLAILVSFSQSGQGFAAALSAVLQLVPIPIETPAGLAGSAVVLVAALLPFIAYFVFLLQYLLIDLVRAVLCVPGKLDALKQ
jgi:hypothetical protein